MADMRRQRVPLGGCTECESALSICFCFCLWDDKGAIVRGGTEFSGRSVDSEKLREVCRRRARKKVKAEGGELVFDPGLNG
jgi:hypothetical protein